MFNLFNFFKKEELVDFAEKEMLKKPVQALILATSGINFAFLGVVSSVICNHFNEALELKLGEVLELSPTENIMFYGSIALALGSAFLLADKIGSDALNEFKQEKEEAPLDENRFLKTKSANFMPQ